MNPLRLQDEERPLKKLHEEMSFQSPLRSRPAVSESLKTTALESLRERLNERLRELQNAEVTIHTLRLEQLARDRQICALKARLFEVEVLAQTGQGESSFSLPQRQDALYDQLVAAADQERTTYLEYIEHLKAQLAQLHAQARE